ncbi:winged helix-turn-helix domain-containing protein [Nitrosopumilus ureiphilus]|uniref:ArsR family transcriptional regulator n=1 Tax=Nitrosopumilus ureiphilus TaxID=1470067 RepID=A0A7D5M3P1_9ARCH|nr:helix-turn-helix domain-containing protein [Nitrosopumilus ureiphilus]QLH05833.1 ArsR family transcriptional regulator [Nitrosopumilus ureiphilus]
MVNISTTTQTSMDIFRAIMDHGPLTLYSANSKTGIPIGTIHRHFKQLSKTGRIRVYESKRKGRKKIEYGPTIYGIINVYKLDSEFARKIENYFLIWIENKEFQKDLESEGFDITFENLKKSKHVFRKYMEYFSAVEDQIEKIKRGEDSISRDIQILFGSMMLSPDPHYQKLWAELYRDLPGTQKTLDELMETMIKSYKEFKRNFKR